MALTSSAYMTFGKPECLRISRIDWSRSDLNPYRKTDVRAFVILASELERTAGYSHRCVRDLSHPCLHQRHTGSSDGGRTRFDRRVFLFCAMGTASDGHMDVDQCPSLFRICDHRDLPARN